MSKESAKRASCRTQGDLNAENMLGWEFGYAKETAEQAMQDRRAMVNFYLIITGIVVSSAVALCKEGISQSVYLVFPGLFLIASIVGWIFFFMLIRLRQAWHESVEAMCQIKAFYLGDAKFAGERDLHTAFRWTKDTIPKKGRRWTIFFLSATLVNLLDSIVFTAGCIMIFWMKKLSIAHISLISIGIFIFLYGLQTFLYFWMLRK